MCLICVEFQQGKLSVFEARKNLSEMVEKVGVEHVVEVIEMLIDASRDKDPKTPKHVSPRRKKRGKK